MLESHARALKTRIFAKFLNKTWAKRMGQLVGAQGQVKVAKKMIKHPHLWRSPSKRQTKNKIFFFDVN